MKSVLKLFLIKTVFQYFVLSVKLSCESQTICVLLVKVGTVDALCEVKFSSDQDYHPTLKMASAQAVETPVANNSPNSHDSNHPDEAFNFQFEKT